MDVIKNISVDKVLETSTVKEMLAQKEFKENEILSVINLFFGYQHALEQAKSEILKETKTFSKL